MRQGEGVPKRSKERSSMLEPCQRCGAQTSVLRFDNFSLRKLCRACFGELVETNHIPPQSLARVQVRNFKDVGNQTHEI